jgi:hypothetical protein
MAQSDAALGGGGILTTVIINVIVATVLFFFFGVLCMRITPFVISKKRKIFGHFLEKVGLCHEEQSGILNDDTEVSFEKC